jgi:hypothetical protein
MHAYINTHTHTHILSLSLSLSHTHTHIHTHTRTHTHMLATVLQRARKRREEGRREGGRPVLEKKKVESDNTCIQASIH